MLFGTTNPTLRFCVWSFRKTAKTCQTHYRKPRLWFWALSSNRMVWCIRLLCVQGMSFSVPKLFHQPKFSEFSSVHEALTTNPICFIEHWYISACHFERKRISITVRFEQARIPTLWRLSVRIWGCEGKSAAALADEIGLSTGRKSCSPYILEEIDRGWKCYQHWERILHVAKLLLVALRKQKP